MSYLSDYFKNNYFDYLQSLSEKVLIVSSLILHPNLLINRVNIIETHDISN